MSDFLGWYGVLFFFLSLFGALYLGHKVTGESGKPPLARGGKIFFFF